MSLFARQWSPPEMSAALAALLRSEPPVQKRNRYALRDGVPRRFQTQDVPQDEDVTEDEVADRLTADAGELLEASLTRADVKVLKRTLEIFTHSLQMEFTFAPPSLEDKQKHAQRTLLGYRTLNAKVLREALAIRLHRMLSEKGFEDVDDRDRLHECLDNLLWHRPGLLREAYKRAVAAKAILMAAEELPTAIELDRELRTSERNVYGYYPPMNSWERAFAEHLDHDDSDTVLWWHRNEAQKPWSIKVLMENGQGFFLDFVIGIRGRPTEDHALLADPKEGYGRTKELPKLAAEHANYGRVLILTKENERGRWEIATWDMNRERPVVAGPFLLSDAVRY